MSKTRTSKTTDALVTAGMAGPDRESPHTPSAEALIRLLVAKANERRAEAEAPAADGVLLKAEVDGVTCVLTRPSPPLPGLTTAQARRAMPVVTLSPREREIARLVAKGYPDKVIASLLEISKYTVGTYLRRMYQKLEVPSRAALIARVMTDNLLG